MEVLLDVRGLRTHFHTSTGVIRAVDGVSWDVRKGETVALVGESGCGKSVSALSVMRLVSAPAGRIVAGEILFKGRNLLALSEEEMRRVRGREIGMIFQEPMTSLNPVLTIGRQLTETVETHLAMTSAQSQARAVELLSLVGIPPTAGFVGKFYLFGAAVKSGYVWLAVIGVLNSAVAAYYYLRLIVYMYMREPEGAPTVLAPSFSGALALAVALWGVVQLGVAPGPLFDLAQAAVVPLLR